MEIKVRGVLVDAGLIMICDASYLDETGVPKKTPPSVKPKIITVPNGNYQVNWIIPKTWNGRIEGSETIEITSGKLLISDPCYVIGGEKHEDWMKWLNDTAYGENLHSDKAFTISKMGGDGSYSVNLELEEI